MRERGQAPRLVVPRSGSNVLVDAVEPEVLLEAVEREQSENKMGVPGFRCPGVSRQRQLVLEVFFASMAVVWQTHQSKDSLLSLNALASTNEGRQGLKTPAPE